MVEDGIPADIIQEIGQPYLEEGLGLLGEPVYDLLRVQAAV